MVGQRLVVDCSPVVKYTSGTIKLETEYMTIAEVFRPDGSAPDMIDSMYDLFISASLHFGVAELQAGQQLFVLPLKPGDTVDKQDVMYELAAWLSTNGYDYNQMADEITNAMIDVI